MTAKLKLALLGTIAILVVATAHAQPSTPQRITLQGFLRLNNVPPPGTANGIYSMSFALFDQDLGGAPLGSVGPMAVDVTGGRYEVELPFAASAFSGSDRFLEITVDSQVLAPRIRVLSTPFAYVAETLDGFEATDLDDSAEIQTIEASLQDQIDQVAADAGNTLDQAYDEGGPGAGRTITADAGEVRIVNHPAQPSLLTTGPVWIGYPSLPFLFPVDTRLFVRGDAYVEGTMQIDLRSRSGAQGGDGIEILGSADNSEVLIRTNKPLIGVVSDPSGNPADFLSGPVHIRHSDPGVFLQSYGGMVNLELRASSANDFYLYDRNSQSYKWIVRNNGDVGIGVEVPSAKLDVAGRTKTRVLEITGGSDIAEPFPAIGGWIEPGSVVVIDEAEPGHVRVSGESYDHRVAGIVSGAGGVNAGLILGQTAELGEGPAVAVSGRAYCRATAANGPIVPGDLLTTSGLHGHAMKATDRGRSHGAILGKAMTALEEGDGLVLVLVNLH